MAITRQITINVNTTQAQSAITQLNNTINQTSSNASAGTTQTIGAYQQLSRQFRDASNEAKNLAVQYGLTDQRAVAAAQNAMALNQQLKAVDATVGQFGRNVGNYNGAMMSFNQLMSEAPNFAISLRTGLLSVSNNIPQLINQIQASVAAGNSLTSVIGAMGKSLLGFGGVVTLLTVGLTLLANPKTLEWFKGLFNGSEDVRKSFIKLESTTKIVNNAFKEGNNIYSDAVTKINKVQGAFDSYKNGTLSAKSATEIYNREVGDAFGKTNNFGTALKNFNSKKDVYIQAMKDMSIANALFASSAEDAVKIVELRTKSLNEYMTESEREMYGKYSRERDAAKKHLDELQKAGKDTFFAQGAYNAAQKNYDLFLAEINKKAADQQKKEINNIQKHQNNLNQEAVKYQTSAFNNLTNHNIKLDNQEKEKNIYKILIKQCKFVSK